MLAGGTLSWFVLMPAIALFGGEATIYPGTMPINEMLAQPSGISDLWHNYIKYIGAGAVAAGGLITLIQTFPLIVRTFKQAMSSMSKKHTDNSLRTQQDLPMPVLLVLIIAIVILIWLVPTFPVNTVGDRIIVRLGLLFEDV